MLVHMRHFAFTSASITRVETSPDGYTGSVSLVWPAWACHPHFIEHHVIPRETPNHAME